MGAHAIDPSDFKDVAMIQEKKYAKAVIKTWICEPDTEGPAGAEPVYRKTTLVARAQAEWAHLVCCAKCGRSTQPSVRSAESGGPSLQSIKLGTVIRQNSEEAIPGVSATFRDAYDEEFHRITGAYPNEKEECSKEQIAAMAHMVKENRAPYAEFAIFGPHYGAKSRFRARRT